MIRYIAKQFAFPCDIAGNIATFCMNQKQYEAILSFLSKLEKQNILDIGFESVKTIEIKKRISNMVVAKIKK